MSNIKAVKLDNFKFNDFSDKQLRILTAPYNESTKDRFFIIADGSIRAGKEQPLSANLYTPSGVRKMGDIKVGDYVFDRTGHYTKVLAIYPQGMKDIYEITFHDGSKTRCGKEHLWTYSTKKCISNGNRTVYTSTLDNIMKDLERLKDRKTMHERSGKYVFPLNGCVNFKEQEIDIDPYLLGLLLGDGCFSDGNCGISFTNNEKELHDYISSVINDYDMIYKVSSRTDKHCGVGYLQVKSRGIKSNIRLMLEKYKLYGCKSYNKFIPDSYKYNTINVRLDILAGLLNTDGSVHINNRPSISYCSTSKRLVDDVAEIARSLGLFVNTDLAVDKRRIHSTHDVYSCTIRVKNFLYNKLSSKHKERLNLNSTKDKNWRLIKSITYIGEEECQCIYVDNEEHLYLTDDFIVTHNTVCMLTSFVLYSMKEFNQQVCAICGKSIGSLKRNILMPLQQILNTLGYTYVMHRSDHFIEISDGEHTNLYYFFGAKDESAADLIQGLTLSCLLLDEVVLMPENFFNQSTGRLSIENAKVFCNCNPGSPYHWFKRNILNHLREKNGLYIHFTMDDNPSLSEAVKNRYKSIYSGVWAARFIKGLWAVSSGVVYDMFTDDKNIISPEDIPYDDVKKIAIGIDYGTANATAFLLGFKDSEGIIYICKEYYFAGRKEAEEENNYDAQKTDLEYAEDMRRFIEENSEYTNMGYRDIPNICDPAAGSFKLQLRRFHMKTKNANNNVLDGIREVASLIAQGKLKISTECKNTIKEIHTYSWDEKAQERTGIDTVLKRDDHCVDAMRYLCMYLKDRKSISGAARNVGI
jgi:PBSX family phage terminase large subunit